jgi:hypothetical protein
MDIDETTDRSREFEPVKTPEEIIKQMREIIPWYYTSRVDVYMEEALQKYARQKCEEQREEIWDQIGRVIEDESFSDEQCEKICNAFRNTPEPEDI